MFFAIAFLLAGYQPNGFASAKPCPPRFNFFKIPISQTPSKFDVGMRLETTQIQDMRITGEIENLKGIALNAKSGTYNGNQVVVKFSRLGGSERIRTPKGDRQIPALLLEAIFSKILSDLKLGPKFYGILNVNGKDAIIMEHIPTRNFIKSPIYTEKPLGLSEGNLSHIKAQLERVVSVMSEHEIYLGDFQFIITPDFKVVVIDADDYRWNPFRMSDISGANQRLIDDALENIKNNNQ